MGVRRAGYHCSIQLFREGLSETSARDNPERCGGWFLVHWWFSKKFERTARETVDGLLRVLKKSNKSRFDSYSFKKESVLIISYITFRDCHLHFLRQPFSTCGSCLLNTHLLNRTFLSFRFPSWCQFDKRTCAVCKCCWILGGRRCRQVCNHLGTLLGTHMSLNDPCLQHTCGLWCKTRYNRGLKSKKYECQTTSVYFFVPGTEL